MQPLIEIQDLKKTYRLGDVAVEALRGVSLAIEEGEFLAIMGPSGSGKTTLMNILGCLDTPTEGHYLLKGRDVSGLDANALADLRGRTIGFVFQNFNLLPRTTSLENVEVPLVYRGIPPALRRGNAMEALKAVGVADRAGHHPSQLSGGQQQRVAIARALVNEPSVLFADEPSGNLDSRSSREIMELLSKLNEGGITVILVTHEADIAAYARRKVLVIDGQVKEDRADGKAPPPSPKAAPQKKTQEPGDGRSPTLLASLMVNTLRTSLFNLFRNRLRSALTMLGIIIGIGSVIALISIGQGASRAMQEQIARLGTNMLVVLNGSRTRGGVRTGLGGALALTADDARAIKEEIETVEEVGYGNRRALQVGRGAFNWYTAISGVTPGYFRVRNSSASRGRLFTESDMASAAKVAVLGETVVENLFSPGEDPLGAIIRLKNVPMKVIGVMERLGQSSHGTDQDDIIYIPFSTAERQVLGTEMLGRVGSIAVSARSEGEVAATQEDIENLLRKRHRIRPGAPDDFRVANLQEIARVSESSSEVMTLFLAAIASVSLLVGGIGIMNIMLVSVTERTREIGVRMALGARRAYILLQFLVEAVVLSATGGVLGVILGVSLTQAVNRFTGWPTLILPLALLGALFFAAAVGIFFGFYPARRASRLNPIECLRYE